MSELFDLHTKLAALYNAHVHFDLRNMPEVDRQTAILDVEEQIEEYIKFQHHFGKATNELDWRD